MRLFAALAVLLLATGCSTRWMETDRCYLNMDRYRALRDVFIETNSLQRTEQIMEEEQWAACERNQFLYLLEKDLYLEDILIEDLRNISTYEPPPDGPLRPPQE